MKRLLLIILGIGLILTSLIALIPSPTSLAQTPVPKTGTATPPGYGQTDDKGTPVPTPQTGAVHGYVYNYSDAAYVPGMTVVLDGGGWKAETVTTSDGYYSFAGLGSSSAVIQLKLPPSAQSAMPDYPIHTGSPEPGDTNVGFYWGENPPIPVILSVDEAIIAASPEQPFEIAVSVKNQSGGEATGGEIDVQLPGGLIALKANASHGKVDFTDHRVWGRLDTLPDSEMATLSVQAQLEEGTMPEGETVQIIFTYNEQITPQLIRINITPSETSKQADALSSPAADAESVSQPATDDAASTEETAAQSTDDAASTESTAAQSADDTTSTETTTEQTTADTTSSDTQAASEEDLIPTTGGQTAPEAPPWATIILSAIFIVGLGVAGFRAFAKRSA